MKAIVRRVWVASMMLPRAGTTTRSDPRRKGHCHSGWTPGRALQNGTSIEGVRKAAPKAAFKAGLKSHVPALRDESLLKGMIGLHIIISQYRNAIS